MHARPTDSRIRHIRQLQLEEPARVEWILVDKGRIVHNCFIDLDHFAGQRCETSRPPSPTRRPRAIALRQSRPDLWKLNEHEVAEASAACSVMPTVATFPSSFSHS